MVSTRRSTSVAAATTIPAARALRRDRRAQQAQDEAQQQVLLTDLVEPAPKRRKGRRAPTNNTRLETINAIAEEGGGQQLLPQIVAAEQHRSASDQEPASYSSAQGSHISDTNQSNHGTSATVKNGTGSQHLQPEPQTSWFGSTPQPPSTQPVRVPPFFQATETLAFFTPGLPIANPKATSIGPNSPSQQTSYGEFGQLPNPALNIAHENQRAEELQKRNDAITKVAQAVMSRMQGKDDELSRDDYLKILDGMFVDPTMRVRLPNSLVEQYDKSLKQKESTTTSGLETGGSESLFNGALVEMFLDATRRATNVTAEILMNNQQMSHSGSAGPNDFSRGSRNRMLRDCAQTPVIKNEWASHEPNMDMTSSHQSDQNLISTSIHPLNSTTHDPQDHHPQRLTEYNLSQCSAAIATNNNKGKSKVWDEDQSSGVVRNSKTSKRRPSPYPSPRVSLDPFNVETRLKNSQQIPRLSRTRLGPEVSDDNGFSIHSASTALIESGFNRKELARKCLAEGSCVRNLSDPNSYESQCLRRAQSVLEATERINGESIAQEVYNGFHIMICYDLAVAVSSEMITDVYSKESNPNIQGNGGLPMTTQHQSNGCSVQRTTTEGFTLPDQQLYHHPQHGLVMVDFLPFIKPNQIHHSGGNQASQPTTHLQQPRGPSITQCPQPQVQS